MNNSCRFGTAEEVRRFVTAGDATVTVVSAKTGTRFTFRFKRTKAERQEPRATRLWALVMNGPDNQGDFAFAGTVVLDDDSRWQMFRGKSTLHYAAPSALALRWFVDAVSPVEGERWMNRMEVWHEGRCGRCGRKLTVPESIASGFGPECAGRHQ